MLQRRVLHLRCSSAASSSDGPETPGLLDTPTTPHPDGLAAMERLKAEQAQEDREKMQLLVSQFTEDQLDRYAMYRRSALPKTTVKKIMQTITGSSVGQNVVIAMAGIAKVFAGEVIEEALTSMQDLGEAGQPVRPKHLREAVRRMRSKGTFMQKTKKKEELKKLVFDLDKRDDKSGQQRQEGQLDFNEFFEFYI